MEIPELFFGSRRGGFGPGALPVAPNRNIAEPESVPPQVKHRLIQMQDPVLGNTCRRWGKLRQALIHKDSLNRIAPSQQMPQRECVALARLADDHCQIGCALLWCIVLEFESPQSSVKLQRGIFDVRGTRTDL